MSLRYMLDTNICIHVTKDTSSALLDRFARETGAMCVSSITLAELLYGAEKSARPRQNRNAAREFTSQLVILTFSEGAAAHFGELRAELERLGTPCGPYDMLIGAHARSEGLTLVTNNRREFDRMPGLRVENWV